MIEDVKILEKIKKRCGIAAAIKIYDEEIESYIEDCKEDMLASGVDKTIIEENRASVLTAITFYVKANLDIDKTIDPEKYMNLYREKVFRLSLEEPTILPAPIEPQVPEIEPEKGPENVE